MSRVWTQMSPDERSAERSRIQLAGTLIGAVLIGLLISPMSVSATHPTTKNQDTLTRLLHPEKGQRVIMAIGTINELNWLDDFNNFANKGMEAHAIDKPSPPWPQPPKKDDPLEKELVECLKDIPRYNPIPGVTASSLLVMSMSDYYVTVSAIPVNDVPADIENLDHALEWPTTPPLYKIQIKVFPWNLFRKLAVENPLIKQQLWRVRPWEGDKASLHLMAFTVSLRSGDRVRAVCTQTLKALARIIDEERQAVRHIAENRPANTPVSGHAEASGTPASSRQEQPTQSSPLVTISNLYPRCDKLSYSQTTHGNPPVYTSEKRELADEMSLSLSNGELVSVTLPLAIQTTLTNVAHQRGIQTTIPLALPLVRWMQRHYEVDSQGNLRPLCLIVSLVRDANLPLLQQLIEQFTAETRFGLPTAPTSSPAAGHSAATK